MGNILNNVSKDNTRFTIFENDQVLTADQLNDLFNYFNVQTRLTRTKAAGVGIINGLEIGLLDTKQIVLSQGCAITTDGDLLFVDADQVFDNYKLFEDKNAKYSYLQTTDGIIKMYELFAASSTESDILKLSDFTTATNTNLEDYVGILYLEDYLNTENPCTGNDCDNKGDEAAANLKILIVSKNDLNQLASSIPDLNSNYFSLDSIAMPRNLMQPGIETIDDLRKPFINALSIKQQLQNNFLQAYNLCKSFLTEVFDGNPTDEWNSILDQQFNVPDVLYVQYVYDFARDLVYAYNELRESLFTGNMLQFAEVELFPKHVLLGLLKTASLKSDNTANGTTAVLTDAANKILLRFNIGSFIRRFSKTLTTPQFRHAFYQSPILKSDDADIEVTRFCFMRLHSLIHNFATPVANAQNNVTQSLKITPGYFEDKPLGKRSIPFYYNYDKSLPVNLYWNFDYNVRKKENDILSYNAASYSNSSAAFSPLLFNILPFDFFRVEGHIGFKYQDVEAALNSLIANFNLPINIVSLQVEPDTQTIPVRPWRFPQLELHANFIKNTLTDHIQQVNAFHNDLLSRLPTVADTVETNPNQNISDSITAFNNASNKVLASEPSTSFNFNFSSFKDDVSSVIQAATDVKAKTRQFTFSNTAAPHDFVINTDILHKSDALSDLLIKQIEIKKQGLILKNFMQQNPGLEHAGGVLRGGTFVLVYTTNDSLVVADFMLPYASVDKDIVNDVPVVKPPVFIPKFDLPKVFEPVPVYKKVFDTNISLALKPLNDSISSNQIQLSTFKDRLNDNSSLFNSIANIRKTTAAGTQLSTIAGIDDQVNNFKIAKEAMDKLTPGTPERAAAEKTFVNASQNLTQALNKEDVTSNPDNTTAAQSLLFQVNAGLADVKDTELAGKANEIKDSGISLGKIFTNRRIVG